MDASFRRLQIVCVNLGTLICASGFGCGAGSGVHPGDSAGPGGAHEAGLPPDSGAADQAAAVPDARTAAWVAETATVPSSACTSTMVLLRVWGSGPTDVWAAGVCAPSDVSAPVLLHSSGAGAWTTPAGGSSVSATILEDVWGTASDDVYVTGATGGGSGIYHTTDSGATFTGEYTGVPEVTSVWGSGATDLYATTPGGKILHSSGGAWSAVYSPSAGIGLYRVWGSGPTDVYAVGWSGAILHSTDGSTWTPQSASPYDNYNDIWGSSPTDIYLAGGSGTTEDLYHSTGDGTWTKVAGVGALAVWGTGADDVYAAGGGSAGCTIAHLSGGTWTAETCPASSPLKSVWGTASGGDVYAVGLSNVILHRKYL